MTHRNREFSSFPINSMVDLSIAMLNSCQLTLLWQIIIFNGKIHYFYLFLWSFFAMKQSLPAGSGYVIHWRWGDWLEMAFGPSEVQIQIRGWGCWGRFSLAMTSTLWWWLFHSEKDHRNSGFSIKNGDVPMKKQCFNKHSYGKIHHFFNWGYSRFRWIIFSSYVELPEGMAHDGHELRANGSMNGPKPRHISNIL